MATLYLSKELTYYRNLYDPKKWRCPSVSHESRNQDHQQRDIQGGVGGEEMLESIDKFEYYVESVYIVMATNSQKTYICI